MRKDRERQKKRTGKQLNLFRDQNGPVGGSDGRTGRRVLSGVELSSQSEEKQTLTKDLLEQVVDYGNLIKAYRQVKRNGGSGGVDGMNVKQLGEWLNGNLKELRETVLTETYEVSAVRKREIDKPSGGVRTLGIPTVKDRLIQQAIHQQLSRYYEPDFSDNSYGFRPGRNAHQAIEQASEFVKSGKEWVVDLDLENFFDKINHDRLMQRLSKGVGDKRLLRLIHAYLRAGMMEGGLVGQRIAGAPQGGPLSPLLSNIVLDELDRELEKRGHCFCRYADDCNIYVSSRKAGERVMRSITNFIERKLKLKINRRKSGVRHCSEVKFLGYTLLSDGRVRIADKSIKRLKDKIRGLTKRNRGRSFRRVIRELNRAIRGWTNYFRLANAWLSDLRNIDGWTRRKLRCFRLKQCGKKYTTYKLLRSFGIPKTPSWNVVIYTQGWWAMSNKVAVSQALNISWFRQLGLLTIEDQICTT